MGGHHWDRKWESESAPVEDNFINRALDRAKMDNRPSYYSGRGALEGDLPSAALFSVYASIKANVSEMAAAQFVQMVADIPVLSATDFLLTLEVFRVNKWFWDPRLAVPNKGVYTDGFGSALGTVGEFLGRNGREPQDDTCRIRGHFLVAHSKELREDQKSLAMYNPYPHPRFW